MRGTRILFAATLWAAHVAAPQTLPAQDLPAARPRPISIQPNSIAAIAYSPSSGDYGYAHNYRDRAEAQNAALAGCKAEDARVVCWVNEGYCALAIGDDRSVWGVGHVFGPGVNSADAEKKAIADCSARTTNVQVVLCLSSDGQHIYKPPFRPAFKLASDLEKKIYQSLKEFGYSDQVASNCVVMTRPWQCDVLRHRLAQAAQDAAQKKISPQQHAQVEIECVHQLAETIRRAVANVDTSLPANWKYFDLAFVVKDRKAQCVGYTQLFAVLGSALGLTCRGTDVVEHSQGQTEAGQGHMAALVDLQDRKTLQVDLRSDTGSRVSVPFVFAEQYGPAGDYWKLKDRRNPLKIHPRIQTLDKNGLIAGVYNNRGNALFFSGQADKGLSVYAKAIQLNPQNASAYSNRGNAYASLGRQDRAIADCSKAIEINPLYAEAFNNRGNAYGKADRLEAGIADYTRAIQLNPKYAAAYFNRGLAHFQLRKLDLSVADCAKAIELNPRYAKAYVQRGAAHAKLGKSEDAMRDLREAIRLDPSLTQTVGRLAAKYRLEL